MKNNKIKEIKTLVETKFVGLFEVKYKNKLGNDRTWMVASRKSKEELSEIYNKVISAYTYALESMKINDIDLACKVIKMEEQVDIMEKSCRVSHMRRLNESSCSIDGGVIYLDIITNLERVSDHAVNIAQQVIARQVGHD